MKHGTVLMLFLLGAGTLKGDTLSGVGELRARMDSDRHQLEQSADSLHYRAMTESETTAFQAQVAPEALPAQQELEKRKKRDRWMLRGGVFIAVVISLAAARRRRKKAQEEKDGKGQSDPPAGR